MLQRTLTYENLNVFTADNGQDALPIIFTKKPDLLIVDWMMPKMDGLTLVRHLRAEDNRTLILMLTARDAIENRVEGLESGADNYLVKPFAPAELVPRADASRNLENAPFPVYPVLEETCRQVQRSAPNHQVALNVPDTLIVIGDQTAL